ncbi:hypothetical protein EDD85DRAFT_14364 [Armillaria nabsnona]|nr:hypothetical protein EDD85DRAFT_14364 [Armillaria nabsnona]
MQLTDGVCGDTGGAVHPFRLVTGSRTPHSGCTHTLPVSRSMITSFTYPATITTSSTLPTDGCPTSSRQQGTLDDGWLGTRSFVLYPSASEDQWDYLAQQPPNPATRGEKPHAEFMFGGGIEIGTQSFDAVGCADDSKSNFECRHTLVGTGGVFWEMVGRRISGCG